MSVHERILLEGIMAAAMFIELFVGTHRLQGTPRKTVSGPFGPEDDGHEIPAWVNVMMAVLLMTSAFVGGMWVGKPSSLQDTILMGVVFSLLRVPELPPMRGKAGMTVRDVGLFFAHWAAGIYWGIFLANLRWTGVF
jgi:hypothetical protein